MRQPLDHYPGKIPGKTRREFEKKFEISDYLGIISGKAAAGI
jgi:hypothetical protein